MSARTPARTVNGFKAWLDQAVSCVTNGQLIISHGGYQPPLSPEKVHSVTFAKNPVSLEVEAGFFLSVRHLYRIVALTEGKGWTGKTAEYSYELEDEEHRKILGYHWHPNDTPEVSYPHMHVFHGAVQRESLAKGGLSLSHNALRRDLNDAHLPTRRIALEDVLRLAIEQFAVQPRAEHRDDWDAVLRRSRESFRTDRTWY